MKQQLELFDNFQAITNNTLALADYVGELASNVSKVLLRGAAQRYIKLRAQGIGKKEAAEEASKTGKGLVGEAVATADFNMQSKLLGSEVRAQINPIANDSKHDIQFIDGTGNVVGGKQLKIGSPGYVRKAVKSCKYEQVVADKDAVEKLKHFKEQGLLDDRLRTKDVTGRQLNQKEIKKICQEALYDLDLPQNETRQLIKSIGREFSCLAKNVLGGVFQSLCVDALIEFHAKGWDKMDWEQITEATFRMAKRSTTHYATCRSISLTLQKVALNCPGSIFGKAAQFLIRKGHWISAGVSITLTIWDDYKAHREGKIETSTLYQNSGGAIGSGIGGMAGGLLGARLLSSFGPFGVFLGAIIGSAVLANIGGHLGKEFGTMAYNSICSKTFSSDLSVELKAA